MKSLIKIPNNQFSEIYSSFLHIFLHNTLFFNKKLELNSGINMNNTTQNYYKFMNHDIQIACFDAEINDLNKVIGFTNSICEKGTVQLLQARGLAGEKHILQAAIQALKAFDNNENTAKDLGLEICLRASAQRQISRALDMLGIKEGKMEVCAVAVDCDKDVLNKLGEILGEMHDMMQQTDEKTLKNLYKIFHEEIKSAGNIERVLIERTALLNLEI